MDNVIVALVIVIILTALASALAGITALLLGAISQLRRSNFRGSELRQVTRDLVATQAALKKAQVNAKHTKAHRAMHDKVESIQFMSIRAREFSKDVTKVIDTVAETLSTLMDLDE